MKLQAKKAIEIIDRLYDKHVVQGHKIHQTHVSFRRADSDVVTMIRYPVKNAQGELAIQINDNSGPFMSFIYSK